MISNAKVTTDSKRRCRDCTQNIFGMVYAKIAKIMFSLARNIIQVKTSSAANAPLGQYHAGIPMEIIHIDAIGQFTESVSGYHYIVMKIDQFTKWLECYAIPYQGAEQVAMSPVKVFIARIGCPLQIHSDQGRNFMSSIFCKLCKMVEISKTRTPNRPCANGQIERYNRTILQAIRCY